MTNYTTEADIEAMAEAIYAESCKPHLEETTAIARAAKAALAASPVHAELERLKAENERLQELVLEAYDNAKGVISNMQELSKRSRGGGFCVRDEEIWLEKVKQVLSEEE